MLLMVASAFVLIGFAMLSATFFKVQRRTTVKTDAAPTNGESS
jgi:hypothetical protein